MDVAYGMTPVAFYILFFFYRKIVFRTSENMLFISLQMSNVGYEFLKTPSQ